MERTVETIDREIAECKEELKNVEGRETEVYTRIVGYYRSVKNWNKGKKSEFKKRVCFQPDFEKGKEQAEAPDCGCEKADKPAQEAPAAGKPASFIYFTKKTCPNCPAVKEYAATLTIPGTNYDVDTDTGLKKAGEYNIFAVPTVILLDKDGNQISRVYNVKDFKAAV